MPRPRTTKGLAKRIELTYYRRLHPFRRWWRLLCFALPVVGVAWVGLMALRGDQRIYTSGSLTVAHRMFERECERCHVDGPRPVPVSARGAPDVAAAPGGPPPAAGSRSGWFFRRVADPACLGCHDGAVHHETQTAELACAACHREHKGRPALARIADRHCTLCHADLQTRTGSPRFERRVVSLAEHPEFAVFRQRKKDGAAIKLSHATHLKKDLPAGEGKRVTLGCVSCHEQDAAGRYMLPIAYEKHCRSCHPLEAAPDLIVPHQRPELVRGFLLARLGGRGGAPAAPAPPADDAPSGTPGRRRGGATPAAEAPDLQRVAHEEPTVPAAGRVWLAQRRRGGGDAPAEGESAEGPGPRPAEPGAAPAPGGPPAALAPPALAQAERTIFFGRQGCPYCHTVEGKTGLPTIAAPRIPARWLPHSTFDHRAHRPLACVSCHAGAAESVETADVLMPKVGLCRECHRAGGGARADCVECHAYHARARERAPDGPLSVPQLR